MAKCVLSEKEARSFLDGAAWGRLACTGPDGPYVVPLHFVLNKDTIYFHSSLEGYKLDCIGHDGRVCFEVSELIKMVGADKPCKFSVRFRSVQVFGKAEIIGETGEKVSALNLLAGKYCGEGFEPVTADQSATVAVIALRIERISGRANID